MTKWNQFANCTTLTWPTECATLFMDLPLLLSNHALLMTWYPGQACRVIIYPIEIYKLKLIFYTINYQQLKITLLMFQMRIQLTRTKAQQWQRVTLWLIQSFQSIQRLQLVQSIQETHRYTIRYLCGSFKSPKMVGKNSNLLVYSTLNFRTWWRPSKCHIRWEATHDDLHIKENRMSI